jgi:alpha-tubulin suppressor-like RCC1 family protein
MPFIKNAILLVGKSYTPVPAPQIGEVAGGESHSVFMDLNTNKTWGWGLNTAGQLGDNSTQLKVTPVSVAGTTKTFCQISGGSAHTVAIDKNGQVWGWGFNGSGQLGNNSIVSQRTPVSILGATKTFCQINGTNSLFTVAIDKNGQAWGWGNNGKGQLGNNSSSSRCTPVSVAGATKTFCQISAGGDISGDGHTVAIDKNGQAWAWGLNSSGELGDNTVTLRLTPVSVAGATKTFCKIAVGRYHTVAIDKNGQAWAWGINSSGTLGDNSTTSRLTPVSVAGATKTFCKITTGWSHNIAIDKNGNVWAWGLFENGQLGDNTIVSRRTPVSVAGATKTFCQIAAGSSHTVAIDKNGKVWAWGLNGFGQLGDNTITSQRTPVSILVATKTFCQIAAGSSHTIAIDKNGQAWAWGVNVSGTLGDNTIVSRRTPVSVLGATKTFCQIAAGSSHTVAIDKNGQAWAWGLNGTGELGDNSITSRRTPVSVLGAVKTFCKIAAGFNHTVAIDKNGRAWGWGFNSTGQLGDNSITQRLTPVSVLGAVKTFCQIATAACHTVAIDKNGRAWGWGFNSTGQLGDNSITSRLTPVSVLGAVKTFCKIAAGGSYTVAIDKNGKVWAWGLNNVGQVGDNSVASRRTPVSVLGATKTFCQIAAGFCHTIAIDKNGQAWAWGLNNAGQVGDNSGNRLTPVRVCNL